MLVCDASVDRFDGRNVEIQTADTRSPFAAREMSLFKWLESGVHHLVPLKEMRTGSLQTPGI